MYRFCGIVLTWLSATFCATGVLAQTTPGYLIVNNNHPEGNFATFFELANNGTFVGHQKVQTGGKGIAEPTELFNPSFPGVATFHSAAQNCVFVADAGTSDIAAIDSNLKVVGRFQGGRSDKNNFTGIALAINKNFLYAAFSGKMHSTRGGTLASFAIHPGCVLHFLGSVPAVGTGYRSAFVRYPLTLAAHAKILIVAYGDGSIESFHFSKGLAQSNGEVSRGLWILPKMLDLRSSETPRGVVA